MSTAPFVGPARRLASALEPIAAQVYFSPECHAAYAELGFGPSPGEANGVALPDGPAYFTSRGSVMGQVHGSVVAAAFAVFNPAVVVPAVAHGWTLTDATTIAAAHDEGTIAQLCRILGDEPAGLHRAVQLLLRAVEQLHPAGKPLFSGLTSLAMPEPPLGVAWRLTDLLREYRGDAHVRGVDGRRLRRSRDRAPDRAVLGSPAPLLPAAPGPGRRTTWTARSNACCLGASSPTTVPP